MALFTSTFTKYAGRFCFFSNTIQYLILKICLCSSPETTHTSYVQIPLLLPSCSCVSHSSRRPCPAPCHRGFSCDLAHEIQPPGLRPQNSSTLQNDQSSGARAFRGRCRLAWGSSRGLLSFLACCPQTFSPLQERVDSDKSK